MVSKFNRMSLPALLLGALTVMFGLQLIRTLFVGMAVYLAQVQEVAPVLVGVLGPAVFLCGFLAPLIRRALGPRNALPVVVALLTLAWLAEKFVSSLPTDLGLSIIGTILFLWSLPFLFESTRATGKSGGAAHAVIALLLGISAETAVKGAFGMIDLSWAQGGGSVRGGGGPGRGPGTTSVAVRNGQQAKAGPGGCSLRLAISGNWAGYCAAVPGFSERGPPDRVHRLAAAGGVRVGPGSKPGWSCGSSRAG